MKKIAHGFFSISFLLFFDSHEGLNSTKICGPGKKECYRKAMEDLNSIAIDGVKDSNVPEGTPHCHCLPSCSSLMYDAEISYGDIGFKNYHRTKTYFASGTKQ